jgi:hypothetical protein
MAQRYPSEPLLTMSRIFNTASRGARFQLIRLLVDRKVYDLIANELSDDSFYVLRVDSVFDYSE